MLRAPIWITSATSTTSATSRTSISSVTIGRPGLLLRLLEQAQALDAEPLEGVRRGARLVGAAAQHRAPVLGDHPGHLEGLVAALHRAGPGDQREVVAADLAAVDVDHGSLALAELGRGELVRLQDRHQVVDARRPLEPQRRDPVAVADRPDHGQQLALRDVGRAARPTRPGRRPRRSGPRSPPLSSRSSSSCKPFRVSFGVVCECRFRSPRRGAATASGGALLLGGPKTAGPDA